MERMASDSEMSTELKKQSSIDEAEEESLTLLWKHFDDHLDSFRSSLRTRLQNLHLREKELEAKETTFNLEVESKANALHDIEQLIQEKRQQIEKGEAHLLSLKSLIHEHNERLGGVEKLVVDKEIEYYLTQQRFKERKRNLKCVEKTIQDKSKEVESKEEVVKRVQRVLDKYSEVAELKGNHLNEILGSIEECKKEYDLKQEQIEELDKEMKLKEEKLCLIQKSIVECSSTLSSKEKIITEMNLKVKDFCLHRQSMEEWSCTLELKERGLEGWVEILEKLELKEKEIESKVEELNLIDKRVNECLNEVQEWETHLESLERSVQECSDELEIKERQLEQQSRELEEKQKEFESIQKSTEEHTYKLKSKEKANILDSEVKIEQFESSISSNGRSLQFFIKKHLKRIDLLGSQMRAILQASSDPAKLVLDAMQGFYPSNSTVDSRESYFDLRVIRRSCILLLEELKRFSPQIDLLVKEEAVKLAADWKAKMTVATENTLEVLGFLRLLAAYELTSTYDVKELQNLLAIVPQHATDLCRDLGITDKAPASSVICSPVAIEEPEPSLEKNAATSSSPNLQLTATTDARNFHGFPNENLSGNHLIHNNPLDVLKDSSDPEKLVLGVIQKYFAEYWTKRDFGSNAAHMMSYISLLDQLMKVSAHVEPPVKEDARKLAIQWKERMRPNSESLEVLCFLHFVATYGLFCTFTGDEIAVLLERNSQHKQTLEFCHDKIPDFIQKLIERKQLVDAVRLICIIKLVDKFPPVPLLEECVEDTKKISMEMWSKKKSLDEKDKVIDHQIAVLRVVIQCIKDYNLESEYPSKNIEMQIVQLDKLKGNGRLPAPSIASNVPRQEQEKRKKRFIRTFGPEFQPHRQRKKVGNRVAVSDARPHPLPTFTPVYQNAKKLVWQFGRDGNDYEIGANVGAIQNAGGHNPYRYLPGHRRYGPN